MNELKNVLVLSSSPERLEQPLQGLSARGVAVKTIEGAYRLVAVFAEEPADGVIVDLAGLRRQDIELIRVLREIRSEVGIVALAESEQRDLAADALCAGADLYLMKPIYGPELLAAIDRAGLRRRLAPSAEPGAGADAESISKLALGVAHEVNNPLTTISGWLQVLASDHAADEKLVGVLQSMKEEADRIAEIVRQLLLFAQQRPPKTGPVDIGRLVADLSGAYAPRLSARGVQVDVNLEPNLPLVAGDEGQLRQACDAILAEAQAGLERTNRLDITCARRDNGVAVVFHDNGAPIPEDDLARIFEPFQHGRQGNGKAIGLCLSQGIIRSHGGNLEAASSESTGTQFTIWLPSHH